MGLIRELPQRLLNFKRARRVDRQPMKHTSPSVGKDHPTSEVEVGQEKWDPAGWTGHFVSLWAAFG